MAITNWEFAIETFLISSYNLYKLLILVIYDNPGFASWG